MNLVVSRFKYLALFIPFIVVAAASAQQPAEIMQLRQDAEQAYEQRDAEATVALFQQLTELDSADPDAWYGLSRGHEWAGNFDDAVSAAIRVQELGYVYRAYLSMRIARLNAHAGHDDAAIRWIGQSLREGYEDRPEIQSDEAFSVWSAIRAS